MVRIGVSGVVLLIGPMKLYASQVSQPNEPTNRQIFDFMSSRLVEKAIGDESQ